MIYFNQLFSTDMLQALCQTGVSRVVVITDTNVGALYAHQVQEKISCEFITIPPGEASKSREMKAHLENELFKRGCGRDTLLIALGGGVVTDLVGFVAATYCRGIPVVYIPTSLLAMVDASVGGKTGINTSFGKNMLGTFTEPQAVFIDTFFLQTLPHQEYMHAFAEIIKHALIADADYFALIEQNIENIKARDENILHALIKRSTEIKLSITTKDMHEARARESLNFGHTIAHALERLSDYAMPHGHAVSIGLLLESRLSYHRGLLSKAELLRIQALLRALHLPEELPPGLSAEAFLEALTLDKKARQQHARFVLLKRIGKVYVAEQSYAHVVAPDEIRSLLTCMYVHGKRI